MTPAPYTRDTLAVIRTRAGIRTLTELAHDLGWDDERLRGVCRLHGIVFAAHSDTIVPKDEAPPRVQRLLRHRGTREPGASTFTVAVGALMYNQLVNEAVRQSTSLSEIARMATMRAMASDETLPEFYRGGVRGYVIGVGFNKASRTALAAAAEKLGCSPNEYVRRALIVALNKNQKQTQP